MERNNDQARRLRDMVEKRAGETRIITVASGKGGVGKSSMVVNLSIALCGLGLRVLIIDADFGLANVDVMLGVSTRYNLGHFLRGERSLSEIVQEGAGGVRFISGGSGVYELVSMDEEKLRSIVSGLSGASFGADIIMFDAGAGVSEGIMQLVSASTETVVVTTPEPTAILDAYALIKTILKRDSAHCIRLLMNKTESKREAESTLNGLKKVILSNLGTEVEVLGYILYDREVSRSIKQQAPLALSRPEGATAREINEIARNLISLTVAPRPVSRLARLFGRK